MDYEHPEAVIEALRALSVDAPPEERAAVQARFDRSAACPRVPLRQRKDGSFHANGAYIPGEWISNLEQNQQSPSCCRHPENHDISAWYSCGDEREKGTPDIYIFHCTCGRCHRRLCVGGTYSMPRPEVVVNGKVLPAILERELTHSRPKWTR